RLISPLIHVSFWVILMITVFEKICKRYFSLDFRLTLFGLFTFVGVLIIPYIAKIAGDRRLETYDFDVGGSYYGLILWLIIGLCFFLLVKKNNLGILGRYAILFYVISYSFIDFGARIFENLQS